MTGGYVSEACGDAMEKYRGRLDLCRSEGADDWLREDAAFAVVVCEH